MDSLVLRTFGITIGVTVLQNTLKRHLPSELLQKFPKGAEISYAIIPQIPSLPEPLRSEVRTAFATSIRNIWYVAIGLSGLGLLFAMPAKALVLSVVTDEEWGFDHQSGKERHRDLEVGEGSGRDNIEKTETDEREDKFTVADDEKRPAETASSLSPADVNS